MSSIWKNTTDSPEFQVLDGDITTDVLIIGGGIAGILCGHRLTAAGVDCIIVEGSRICSGVTGNTTAKITLQHGLCYHRLIEKKSFDSAQLYYDANAAALAQFEELAGEIDCDYSKQSSFVYSTKRFDIIEREYSALTSLGAEARIHENVPLPVEVKGAVEVKNQAQYHPLKLLYSLAQNLKVYENTFVRDLKGTTAFTDHGTIKANKVIIASHFPFINRCGFYFSKLYQHRSYVIALEGGPDVNGMYVDDAQNGFSFRNWNNYLFIGGGDHQTGKPGGCYEPLRAFAEENYPEATERFSWATQDCTSLDSVPYIGRYSRFMPNVYVATGFNKWGMSSSMVAANILTELITEGKSKYEVLFSPQRSPFNKQLLTNFSNSLSSYFSGTGRRCPHMGCALEWNPVERSWDCPCHGSRFQAGGKLLDNPSMHDID